MKVYTTTNVMSIFCIPDGMWSQGYFHSICARNPEFQFSHEENTRKSHSRWEFYNVPVKTVQVMEEKMEKLLYSGRN